MRERNEKVVAQTIDKEKIRRRTSTGTTKTERGSERKENGNGDERANREREKQEERQTDRQTDRQDMT